MSRENAEIVQRSIDAWNRRDPGETRRLYSADAEIDWSRSMGPLRGVYRGHAGIETFSNEFFSAFDDIQLDPHDLISVGCHVVVPNTAHLRGREGIEVIARSALVYTLENGKITRLRMFQERAEALEAAGLRDSSS